MKPHRNHQQLSAPAIPEADRVPLKQKIAFGTGIVADHCATMGLNSFALPIFNIVLGLSPTLASLALGVARLWDAFTDPMMGSISDNSRSRFGRRKPFLLVGAILTGAFFPVIWLASPDWSQTWIFLYLSAATLLHYTFYTIFSVPYQSLGMELTASYRERTNVYAWMVYMQQISSYAVHWMLALASLEYFGSLLNGARVVGIGIGILIIVCGALPALLCVERYQTVAQHQAKESFWASLRTLKRNTPLLLILGAIGTYLIAITTCQVLDFYVNTYFFYGGDIKAGAMLTGLDGTIRAWCAIAGAFAIQRLSSRFDKHQLLLVCVAVLFLSRVAIYFTFIPGSPQFFLAVKAVFAVAENGFWILVISMRADAGDWDEWLFGRRREGMIAAANNWIAKLAMTLAAFFGGFVLDYVVHFDRTKGGMQSTATLDRLMLAYVIIPIVALAFVFHLLRRYPLTQSKLAEIRAELETRRAAV